MILHSHTISSLWSHHPLTEMIPHTHTHRPPTQFQWYLRLNTHSEGGGIEVEIEMQEMCVHILLQGNCSFGVLLMPNLIPKHMCKNRTVFFPVIWPLGQNKQYILAIILYGENFSLSSFFFLPQTLVVPVQSVKLTLIHNDENSKKEVEYKTLYFIEANWLIEPTQGWEEWIITELEASRSPQCVHNLSSVTKYFQQCHPWAWHLAGLFLYNAPTFSKDLPPLWFWCTLTLTFF